MVIFDTNVFIYAGNGSISLSKFKDIEVGYASISCIEALGFHEITAAEQRALQRIFDAYRSIELTPSIIERAIALRQNRKMSLGDAIIAATALDTDLVLWTANIDDFKHIEGLKILNPLA
ncbi:type II toxin-antitoxin system VapC family toxin [Candidatus Saccharibacteria bacterium]|nr:type II toxin-antitoxin system VapC family toxin [Candidatus Saccharibacteria bacterium]